VQREVICDDQDGLRERRKSRISLVRAAAGSQVLDFDRSNLPPFEGIICPPVPPYLDLWLRRQYIAATCCRPALTDIRRGFEIPPNNRARLPAHPSEEGWALEGCSDSLKA